MSHIFISYSRRDLDFAQKIVDALAANELDTWIDWKSIPKGEDWEQEIYRGIEEADAFLFLISPDSVASEMCNKEIAHAVKNGKRILPIFIANVDNRGIYGVTEKFLHKEQKEEISRRNFVKCRDGQDDFNKAIEEIQTTIHIDYDWVRFHTSLQVKALAWERAKKDGSRLLRGKELKEVIRNMSQSGVIKEPVMTSVQLKYLERSKWAKARQQTIVVGVILTMLLIAGWWDKTWFRLLPIASVPPAVEKIIADVQGMEALPPDVVWDAKSALDQNYVAMPDEAVPPISSETVSVHMFPDDKGGVLVEISLPITPAYRLDFLPEIRKFEVETVTPDETARLLEGVLPYSVGRYSDAIKALTKSESLSGKILLAQAYLFENDFEAGRNTYFSAIEMSEARSQDASQIRMGAALAWWMPNLSQARTDTTSRASYSRECTSASELYARALSSPNVSPDDFFIFQIASHYCSDAPWEQTLGQAIAPDENNPLSVFARLLRHLNSSDAFSAEVMEGLKQSSKSIVYARFEWAWYALLHNGEAMLCTDFATARDWYRSSVVTDLDRGNVRFLLRQTCNQ